MKNPNQDCASQSSPDDLPYSREDYEPEVVSAATALGIGLGALGQNCCLNLTLVQVGALLLADYGKFDHFSNRTRSPLYPDDADLRRHGRSKAPVVAHKLRECVSWSSFPLIRYFDGFIQAAGDVPFREASVVLCCVDSPAARAYISDMARRHGKPLVEGGFDGADISLAVYRNAADDPCWCCANLPPEPVVRFSCDAHAREVAARGFIPAIQPAAAVLGGLMAEAAIQVLHDTCPLLNRRLYMNVRTGRTTSVPLATNPTCFGRHAPLTLSPLRVEINRDAPVRHLLECVGRLISQPTIHLPQAFIAAAPCQLCSRRLVVQQPIWAIESHPVCQDCGGTWTRDSAHHQVAYEVHHLLSGSTGALLDLPCTTVGIRHGTVLDVINVHGDVLVIDIFMPDAVPLFQLV